MIRLAIPTVLLAAIAHAAPAAPPAQPDGARLARALDRLQVVGSVLYVAAHPDDENTRLIAWMRNHELLRTTYLSVTRGDGGQNLIGAEQGPLLGLIRTQELLAARRLDGGEQLFTQARDFGFSKSPDEALAIWGHDATLADVVLAIRRTKPDVILTRFPPDGTHTHGHHTASAKLALEAFEKAADPSYHPEQVKRWGAWRAKRIVWNDSAWDFGPQVDRSKMAKLDVGGYDPALGLSYGELSADSRSMHKSQGFGVARRRGEGLEYFQLLAGEPMKSSPLDGVVTSWSRVPGSQKLADALRRARAAYRIDAPEAALPALLEAHDLLGKLPESPEADRFRDGARADLESAILACAGLFVEVTAAAPSTVPGGKLPITVAAIARRPAAIRLRAVRLPGRAVTLDEPLPLEKTVERKEDLAVPATAALSNPYWLERAPEAGRYPLRDEDADLTGLPEGPSPLEAEVVLDVAGRAITVRRAVAYKWVDPVQGERYRAVEVLPPVTVDADAPVVVFPDGKPRPVTLRLRSTSGAQGSVRLELPAGFHAAPASADFDLAAAAEREVAFQVTPPSGAATVTGTLRAVATVHTASGDLRCDRGLRRIDHPHIPIQTLLPPAEVRLVRASIVRHRRHIGYIAGAGDEVPAALRQIGYDVTELGEKELRDQPLDRYDAIVSGVRAWNVSPGLAALHDKLLAYVAHGGTLVAQYNTNNHLSGAPPPLGPYPLTIGQGRVTDEKAAIDAASDAAVLAHPNKIAAADWDGWVQERGLYFAEKWDDRYQAPLALHDPGEPPQKGALLVGKYGKGTFIYTGLAFFRQLPAGVPGAFRLFANLIEHGAR